MRDPKPTPAPTQRKRVHAPGHIQAVYTCHRCGTQWGTFYPAPWALLDPMYKRDICPNCNSGAGILMGYTSCLPLASEAVQLTLGFDDLPKCTTAAMRCAGEPCYDVGCPACTKLAVL